MSEWDYTNERVLFLMDLNGDFEWVCSTITSQNIYGRVPTIILLTMRPSRLFVKIRCHAVPSTQKRSANGLPQAEVAVDFSPAHPRPMEITCVILTV
ncbi:core histone macro-H2A.1 [Trichonephila clavipes]|nr:core histone macro-H2A.1 [Trichonephila clavipes]